MASKKKNNINGVSDRNRTDDRPIPIFGSVNRPEVLTSNNALPTLTEVKVAPVEPTTSTVYPCAGCGKPMPTGAQAHRCRYCGAVRTTNAVSGNEIWMRNGQVVAAYADARVAYLTMAAKWNVPKEQWPKEFLDS